jgi:hypothetical protein
MLDDRLVEVFVGRRVEAQELLGEVADGGHDGRGQVVAQVLPERLQTDLAGARHALVAQLEGVYGRSTNSHRNAVSGSLPSLSVSLA